MSVILEYFDDIETIKKDNKDIEKYLIQLFNTISPEKNFKILCEYHKFYRKEQFDSIKKVSGIIGHLVSNDKLKTNDLIKKINNKFKKIINEFSKQLAKNDNITFETMIKIGKKEVKVHHIIITLLSLNIFYRDDLREIFNKSINNSFLTVKEFFNGLSKINELGFFFEDSNKMGLFTNNSQCIYLGYEFIVNQLEIILKDSFTLKMINYEVLSHEFAHSIQFDFTKKIETLNNKVSNLFEIIIMDTIFYKKKNLYKLISQALKEDDLDSIQKIIRTTKNNNSLTNEINQLNLTPIDADILINLPYNMALIQEKINYFRELFFEWPAILASFLFVYKKAMTSTDENFNSFFNCNKNAPLTKTYQLFIRKFASENYRAYANTNLNFLNWLSKNPNQPLNEIITKINESLTNEILSREFILLIEKTIEVIARNHLIKSLSEKEYQKQVLLYVESFKKELL